MSINYRTKINNKKFFWHLLTAAVVVFCELDGDSDLVDAASEDDDDEVVELDRADTGDSDDSGREFP